MSSTKRAKLAKVTVGGLIAAGTVLPVTLVAASPAWAYGPSSSASTSTSTVPTTSHVVVASSDSPSSDTGLAFTGADITGGLAVAAVAIAGGGSLVVASRRRRHSN